MKENAYLLLLHNDTKHIRFLIEYLSNSSDVFVHMDKKSEAAFVSLSIWVSNNSLDSKVTFIQDRCKVYWADSSMVFATVKLLMESSKNRKYKHFTLLSGDCVPLRPLSEFEEFLLHDDSNYLDFSNSEDFSNRASLFYFGTNLQVYRKSKLFRKSVFFLATIIGFVKKRRLGFQSLKVYKGSQWFTFHRDFVDYLIKLIDSNSFLSDIKFSTCSDEIFFHTIIMNSPFRNSISGTKIRYIPWSQQSNSPRFIREEDIPLFGGCFFSRKSNIYDETEVSTYLKDILKNR